MTNSEHPFAPFIRTIGKGKTSQRSLTLGEAQQAMQMIMRGDVRPEQLGAFLMLLRVKEETSEELAGFTLAVRSTFALPEVNLDLDWPSYAGKRSQPPWYLLAALALANSGYRIVMHGSRGHTEGRVYSEDVLRELDIAVAQQASDVEQHLQVSNFAFIPLQLINEQLQALIELRPLLGVRTPVHSLCRLLNPFAAQASVQSVFHPSYAPIHQGAAHLLGQANLVILKGDGGEFELRPHADSTLYRLSSHDASETTISRVCERADIQKLSVQRSAELLRAVWQADLGATTHTKQAQLAITGTIAAALHSLHPELTEKECHKKACYIWSIRASVELD
ncbi:MAG: glycosyl transferase family protein [Pseudomonadales bacterium]